MLLPSLPSPHGPRVLFFGVAFKKMAEKRSRFGGEGIPIPNDAFIGRNKENNETNAPQDFGFFLVITIYPEWYTCR